MDNVELSSGIMPSTLKHSSPCLTCEHEHRFHQIGEARGIWNLWEVLSMKQFLRTYIRKDCAHLITKIVHTTWLMPCATKQKARSANPTNPQQQIYSHALDQCRPPPRRVSPPTQVQARRWCFRWQQRFIHAWNMAHRGALPWWCVIFLRHSCFWKVSFLVSLHFLNLRRK